MPGILHILSNLNPSNNTVKDLKDEATGFQKEGRTHGHTASEC